MTCPPSLFFRAALVYGAACLVGVLAPVWVLFALLYLFWQRWRLRRVAQAFAPLSVST